MPAKPNPSRPPRLQSVPSDGSQGAAAPEVNVQLEECVALASKALWRSATLNFGVRVVLAAAALVSIALAIAYTALHGDEIAGAVADSSPSDALGLRLISLTAPPLLFTLFAALCACTAWVAFSRGREELERGLDGVARLQREAEAGIAARGLTHVFEEKLATAHRAFTLLLWLGRTLFIVSLTLFAAAVVNAIATGVGPETLILGGSSLLSALFGTARIIPERIACHLADVLQIQCAVTGCIREISLLEAEAYALLCRHKDDPENVAELVCDLHTRIDEAVQNAVVRIEDYADPSGARRTSG